MNTGTAFARAHHEVAASISSFEALGVHLLYCRERIAIAQQQTTVAPSERLCAVWFRECRVWHAHACSVRGSKIASKQSSPKVEH